MRAYNAFREERIELSSYLSQRPEERRRSKELGLKEHLLERSVILSFAQTRPIIGFAAWSNTGKTTFITKLVQVLKAKGIEASLIKHHGHGDFNLASKDSTRYMQAGVQEIIAASDSSYIQLRSNTGCPSLFELAELCDKNCPLILVEGFKRERFSKFFISRKAHNDTTENPPIFSPQELGWPGFLGLITDDDKDRSSYAKAAIPSFDLDDTALVASYIELLLKAYRHRTY